MLFILWGNMKEQQVAAEAAAVQLLHFLCLLWGMEPACPGACP